MSKKLATIVSASAETESGDPASKMFRFSLRWHELDPSAVSGPKKLYFDRRGEKNLLPVDRTSYHGKPSPLGHFLIYSRFVEAVKGGRLPAFVWFDFGPIVEGTAQTRGMTMRRAATHPAGELIPQARASILIPRSDGKLEDWWVTVLIPMRWVSGNARVVPPPEHLLYDTQMESMVTFVLEKGNVAKKVWFGKSKYKYASPEIQERIDEAERDTGAFTHKVSEVMFKTTLPHDLLPYAMAWAENQFGLPPSVLLGAAVKNPKAKQILTLRDARRRYEALGRKLARKDKLPAGAVPTPKGYRLQAKTERRILEREWGSAIRDQVPVKPRSKRKAEENPSAWYLGGQKKGVRGMQYYYLNRWKPYVLYLSAREPKKSGKPHKIHVEVKKAYPGPDAETEIRLGNLTPEEWWASLDPQRPTRWRGGSLTLEPIASKRFYYKGHLTSLKYQALDWADSVVFTPSERLGLL